MTLDQFIISAPETKAYWTNPYWSRLMMRLWKPFEQFSSRTYWSLNPPNFIGEFQELYLLSDGKGDLMFNTLKYAKILEEVGFSREQAETSIKILVEIMEDRLASKQDLHELKTELQHSIAQLESKLTIRMGTMLAASIAIITTIQKLL